MLHAGTEDQRPSGWPRLLLIHSAAQGGGVRLALPGDVMSMLYKAAATVAPGGEAHIDVLKSSIKFDGTAGAGGVLPGPAHLLAAALCACMLKNVERMSGMLPFKYSKAEIEAEAQREEPPPRITRLRYTLRVHTDESAKRIELLIRNILKHGTITNTLASVCKLEGTVIGVRTNGTQEAVQGE